jgi:hypothetical protein
MYFKISMVFYKQLANSLVAEYKRWILITSKVTYPPIILKCYFQKIYLNIIVHYVPSFYFRRGLTAEILYATFVSVIRSTQSDLPHITGWTVFITTNIFNCLLLHPSYVRYKYFSECFIFECCNLYCTFGAQGHMVLWMCHGHRWCCLNWNSYVSKVMC